MRYCGPVRMRYRQLFSSMQSAFALHEIICDSEGRPCDYRFLEVNKAFEELTGLKGEELIGKTVLTVLPGTEQSWIDTYGKVALEGSTYQFEDFSREIGKYYSVVAYSPQRGQFATIFNDVTEQKKLQQNMIQNSKLGALGTLSAGIAHELNTPLAGILGYSQLIGEQAQGDIGKWAALIESQVHRMSKIIRHMLKFARESTEERWETLHVNQIITDSLIFLERRLSNSDIEVKLELDKNETFFYGKSNDIESIFQNLLINSMDAFASVKDDRKKEIRIVNRFIDGHTEIIYQDNAGGMAPEVVQRIFDPFYTTKKLEQGTGLGMSIVHGIVARHHGHIAVDSTPGEGSRFTIVLPLLKKENYDKAG